MNGLAALLLTFALAFVSCSDQCGCDVANSQHSNLFLCAAEAGALTFNFYREGYDQTTHELRYARSVFERIVLARAQTFYAKMVFSRQGYFESRSAVFSKEFFQKMFQSQRFYEKRALADVCSCLSTFDTCLQGTTCGEEALTGVCNWNNGRMFGMCNNCTGLLGSSDVWGYQTEQNLLNAISNFQPAIVEFLQGESVLLEEVFFQYDFTTNTLTAFITVADGDQNGVMGMNDVTFYLSQLFDVLPGTITYDTLSQVDAIPAAVRQLFEKRSVQSVSYSARVVIVDEDTLVPSETSSASSLAAGVFALVIALRALF